MKVNCSVLGRDPWTDRAHLMRDVCFISDVAVLPRWIKVSQALDYVAGVHPRFDRAKAEGFLAKTTIKLASKVRELSKGMVVQLHLALVMAIDARLLVLDEPTLGLDILYRKQFYDSLLNDYFDRTRTIIVTTHQVEEVEHVLTDLMFINRGRIVLDCTMEEFESRYVEVIVNPDHLAAARAFKPMHERQTLGRSILLFDQCRPPPTRRPRRSPHAQHRRPVRCRNDHSGQPDTRSNCSRSKSMSTPSSAIPDSPLNSQAIAPTMPTVQPFLWSVCREMMEYRSIYIALLAAGALYLFGFLISVIHLPGKIRAASALDPMQQHKAVQMPYHLAAFLLMGVALLVSIFYCLEALHAERRDRSILFWKSLPVSDLTAVLAKASIPIVVLPLLAFAVTIALQWLMLLLSSGVLLASGMSPAILWKLPWIQMSVMLFCHLLFIHGFWYAPYYSWFLLVSAWARRAPFLWATLPLLTVGFLEKLVFNTTHFANFLGNRFMGGGGAEFPPDASSMNPMAALNLGGFLTSPGLWIGLIVTAAFLAAAVRLRRNRGPI